MEWVDPVVEGIVRAKQTRFGDSKAHQKAMSVLIHGDAAFAGQGVVAETLNLSQLSGYRTGGTVHIIVNNQIGFTTTPEDSRSTTYATDVAKMIQAPIFHVNGDDPEAALWVTQIAFEFKWIFKKMLLLIYLDTEDTDTMKAMNRVLPSHYFMQKLNHIHQFEKFMKIN